jgi:uncharacterized protein involved in outer membrane biogenesis
MKLKRIALWSGITLAALLAFALTWLWTVDLGIFKPQLERLVSEKTGREFAINGELSVELSRHASVIAEDVQFQNAEWGDAPYMVEVGRVEIRVALWSIISGPILVELIDVDHAEIRLVQREDNEANWTLPLQGTTETVAEDEPSSGFEMLFDLVDIDDLHVVFESPRTDIPLDLHVEQLDQRRRDDGFLQLFLQAELGNRKLNLEGEVGTWAALLTGEDIQFDLQGQLDTVEVQGSGLIDNISRPFRPSFRLSASSPDISGLAKALGFTVGTRGSVELSGSLTPQDNGPLILDVNGNIGETEINAAGEFSNLQDFEQVDVDLLASGPDLGRILRLAGVDQVREAPFMIDIDAKKQGPMLIVNRGRMVFAEAEFDISARLPDFPKVDDASIAIQIDGPDLERFRFVTGLPGAATGAFSIGFELQAGATGQEILTLQAETSLGRISGSGVLGESPKYLGSTFELQLTSDSLAQIGNAYGVNGLPDRPLSLALSATREDAGIRTTEPLMLKIDGVSLALDGLVALHDGILGSELSFDLAGPNLAAIVGDFGLSERFPEKPFDVGGNLQVSKSGYRFADVTAMIGSSKLDLSGLLAPVSGLAGSNVTFELSGPAIEELVDDIGDLKLQPGSYKLAGTVGVQSDLINLDGIKLEREKGHLSLDIELGLPMSRQWANFNVQARGNDVRNIISGVNRFEAPAAPFLADVRGELREKTLSFDKLEFGIADARVRAQGELDLSNSSAATNFSFTGDIPSLSQFGQIDGRGLRDQGVKWKALVTGSDGVLTVDDLNLTLGESDVRGFVRYTKGEVPKLEVAINSESIAFDSLLEEDEFEYDPEPEFDDGRLIPDMLIPFDSLKKLNASIGVSIDSFTSNALLMRNIKLAVELQDGVLDVSNASFDARSGWARARAKLDHAGGSGKASLEFVARDFAMGLAQMNVDLAMTGDMDIKLESTGVDVRTLAGNLNGVVFADTRGGRMTSSRTLNAIYGDMLSEILSAINPFYKSDPTTDFKCIVIALEIVDGRLSSVPNSYFGTDKIRLTSKSSIDFKTEKIDMNIRTTPQQGLSISGAELFNPYLKIVGTLAAPRLAVDEQGVLISGGAAVATGGLSVLAKMTWDRVSRSREPCKDTAKNAREALGVQFPNIPPAVDQGNF